MPTFQQSLSEEVRRLARKEIKTSFEPIREKLVHLRKQNSELKKRIALLEKGEPASAPVASTDSEEKAVAPVRKSRFSGDRIKKLRKKYGLSQGQFASILGVSLFSVSHWESGKTRPRENQRKRIMEIRAMGKKEIFRALKEVKAPETSEPTQEQE